MKRKLYIAPAAEVVRAFTDSDTLLDMQKYSEEAGGGQGAKEHRFFDCEDDAEPRQDDWQKSGYSAWDSEL